MGVGFDWREVRTGGANGGTAVARADARVREERLGLAYKRAGGWLGVGGVTPVPLARVERPGHGRRRAPLRRLMARHGRCAGRWISTTWRGPLATDGTGESPPALRSDRWSLRCLGVRARRGTARTTGGRRGRARCRSRARLGVPGRLHFTEVGFKLLFLWIFKLKCTLWSKAKLKITHPSTTFTMVGRGFMQGIEQERHAKLAKFSAPMNSKLAP
jgi:hypothetical protein